MSKNFEAKKVKVAEISEKLKNAKSMVVVSYNAITVEEVTELRNQFRANGVEYCVLRLDKNSVRFGVSEINSIKGVDDIVELLRQVVDIARPKYLFILGNEEIVDVATWDNEGKTGDADVDSDFVYSVLDTTSPWEGQEFNAAEARKGIALTFAAEKLGFSLAHTAAFGDSLNDLPMLQAAGHSVVVANGRPDVRALCDEICLSNQEDGVARWLEEHILSGEVLS